MNADKEKRRQGELNLSLSVSPCPPVFFFVFFVFFVVQSIVTGKSIVYE
jgi:hypothetical protein